MDKKQLEKITNRYYKGISTAIEERMLFEKISQSTEAYEFFRDFEQQFAQTSLNTRGNNEKWHTFQKKHINSKRIRQRKLIRTATKYAAIFAFGILIASAYQMYSHYRATIAQPAEWYHTYVPRGEKSKLILPDGTKVWLNAETTLKYPVSNAGKERIMKLEGEAYFEVKKNKDRPFVVETPHYDVVVKGTSFNIMAYNDINRTETSLVTGKVTIRNIKKGKNKSPITLNAGKKMIFNKENHALNIETADMEQDMAWKNNLFVFSETNFEELCKRLERWYDVDVTLADKELKKIRYTGKFRNEETIWQVLDIIKITTPIEYELENRKVTIYKD